MLRTCPLIGIGRISVKIIWLSYMTWGGVIRPTV
jgi:hypothetical protein